MSKGFLKPNRKKIILTILLCLFTGFMLFRLTGAGFTTIPRIITMILGFPVLLGLTFGFFEFFLVSFIFSLIVNLFWLYIISCILIALITPLIKKIKWNSKTFIILGIILVLGFLVFAFFKFGGSDIFVAAADDRGATIEGVKEVVNANNQFSVDLYSKINQETEDNIFFSPWSISTAVAMAYEGAREDTASEIQDVFYFPEEDSLRRSSYASMLNTLNKAGGEYKLSTANAIWLQEDYPFLDTYKDTINNYYLGEVKNLDFVNNPSGASSKINNWVSRNTNNKIPKIVSPGMFNSLTRAVLTNAIYFKGKWEHQFDKKDTKPEDFTLESGDKIKVPMMRLTDEELDFNYAESDGVQILEMPYKGDKISMLVLLPRTEMSERLKDQIEYQYQLEYGPLGKEKAEIFTSNMTHLESILSEEKLQEWRGKLRPQSVYIYMPKYKFETTYSLTDYLKDMGMSIPFTLGAANFSGMDGTDLLYIDEVLHKAYIDVYEEGTEAAAATAIMIGCMAAGPSFIEFRADHPFIFIIQETETGNILFMGKVNDPSQIQ
jgi:serpin B